MSARDDELSSVLTVELVRGGGNLLCSWRVAADGSFARCGGPLTLSEPSEHLHFLTGFGPAMFAYVESTAES